MESAERKNGYCYKFSEQPGDKYCMEVVLNPTSGAVDTMNGPYRMAAVELAKPDTPAPGNAPAGNAPANAPSTPPANAPANAPVSA